MGDDYPSRKMDQFVVRLPDGMRDRIKDAAEANGRSMNSEIVAALEEKFPEPASSIPFNEIYDLMSYVEAGKDEAEMAARSAEVNERLKARGTSISIQISVDPSTGEPATHMSVR